MNKIFDPAGAYAVHPDTAAFFPLQPDWAEALSRVSRALAEQTKDGLRITFERHHIQDAIDYLEIALKNEMRNAQ